MLHLRPLAALFIIVALLATILPSPAAIDCTVIVDAATGKVLKQDGPCTERITPASTFKIAISLMGYDSGFLKDEHTPLLPFKPGYLDYMPDWKQPIDPTSWLKYSVVWYSQQITQALGEKRFQHYVTEFQYGNEDVSGNPGKHDGLTRAWLSSSLKISPLEQAQFLRKLVRHELPVSPQAFAMTDKITTLGTLPNGWELHGKTGTGSPVLADGMHDTNHDYGWFVGWVRKGDRTLVFARLQQNEKKTDQPAGPRVREEFTKQLPNLITSLTK